MPETVPETLDYDSMEDDEDGYWFDHACETLTAMLDALDADDDTYTARGQNVGWRNVRGTSTVTLTDGRDLVRKLVPDGDFTLSATLDAEDDSLSLRLSHHDSPTGETHVITPAEER